MSLRAPRHPPADPEGLDDRALCLHYTTGRDVTGVPPADFDLLPFDLWTNLAHAVMLSEMAPPVFSAAELERIKAAVNALDERAGQEDFTLDFGRPGDPGAVEDVHYYVERYVCQRAGDDVGRKLHTARSRNDQVATDLRLLVRDRTVFFAQEIIGLIGALLRRAEEHSEVVMPGYTHHQHGAVSSLGFLWLAHAEAFGRDLERLRAVAELANRCPLGAVMGFGTSWPIDRQRVAALLGFDAVQVNSLDAVTSRGEIEATFVSALAQFMNHLAGLAQDLLLMTTQEFGFFRVADTFTTGSSVMPQKRNLDFAEVTKAKAAVVAGHLNALLAIARGQFSGYNRDTQWTKFALLDAARECALAPRVFARVITTLEVDDHHRGVMLQQCRIGYLNAVDVADYLSTEKGLAFRTAHGVVRAAVDAARNASPPLEVLTSGVLNETLAQAELTVRLSDRELESLSDPAGNLIRRLHMGSPSSANTLLRAVELNAELRAWDDEWTQRARRIRAAREALR